MSSDFPRPFCPFAREECHGAECALAIRTKKGFMCCFTADSDRAFTARYVDMRDARTDAARGLYG